MVLQGSGKQFVEENRIGTAATGTGDLGNSGSGVYILGGANIGLSRNVVSGNDSHGISLTGSSVKHTGIWDDFIGTTRDGSSASANFNVVSDNTIAHNTGDRIIVESTGSTQNSLQQNFIYSNSGLGIDLGDDWVTANEDGDGDSGPNNLQNFPVLQAVALRDDAASVSFKLDVVAGIKYFVDLYASNSCDASDNGEGREWSGLISTSSGASGKFTFRASTYKDSIEDYQFPSEIFPTTSRRRTPVATTSTTSRCAPTTAA